MKAREDKTEIQCVWFSDIDCPIRTILDNKQKVNKAIRPKQDDGGLFGMIPNMMQQISMDISVLPAYCDICHLRKKRVEII